MSFCHFAIASGVCCSSCATASRTTGRGEASTSCNVPKSVMTLVSASSRSSAPGSTRRRELLKGAGVAAPLLSDAAGAPTWAIEYRIVEHEGKTLAPLINFAMQPQIVKLL